MANGGIIGPVQTVTAESTIAAKVTTFNSSGTFTAQATANVDYLVVAGGAGSGCVSDGNSRGGGGGAGGYRASGFGPSPLQGCAVPVVGSTGYTITIGGGGPASSSAPTGCGEDSVFNYNGANITSAGGGHGGSHRSGQQAGGSGGGSGPGQSPSGAAGNTPPTDPPQGNSGGDGTGEGPIPSRAGGGGGGATASGPNASSGSGGNGGAGAPNTISGSDVTYAVGGDGAPGSPNSAGTTNRGNGGNAAPGTGGNAGGSGVVIIKEPESTSPATAPGVWNISEVYNLRKTGEWTGF